VQPNRDRKAGTAAQKPFNHFQRRSELEAKLLAYRCGWLAPDEIRVRRLKRELARLLEEIQADDAMARALLD
jgi:hypothetical protein